MNKASRLMVLAGALAFAVGCGGGGGGTSTNPGNGGGTGTRVGVFVTDAIGDYDHVWVTIKKVALVGPMGKATAFEDANGKVIDLVSLNQAGQQQFALLGVGTVPAGDYNKVEITVDEGLIVFPAGSPIGSPKTFEASNAGTKVLDFAINAPVTGNIVADFDLSQWEEIGNTIRAVVKAGDAGNVDDGTQVTQQFEGNLTNLAGTTPDLSFDLVRGTATIHVQTDSATAIANSDGSENPTLANGAHLHVDGILDTTTHTLKASSVTIQIGEDAAAAQADGTVTSTTTDSFTILIRRVRGFVPTSTTLNIGLTPTTVYATEAGVSMTREEALAALATSGAKADADGTYNPASNTLTATRVTVDVEQEQEGLEIKVIGGATNVDAAAGTFKVTVLKWEGALLHAGDVIDVVTNGSTDMRDVNLAALSAGTSLEVRGSLDGTTMTATRVRTKSSGGGGNGGGGNGGGGNGGGDDGGHGGHGHG